MTSSTSPQSTEGSPTTTTSYPSSQSVQSGVIINGMAIGSIFQVTQESKDTSVIQNAFSSLGLVDTTVTVNQSGVKDPVRASITHQREVQLIEIIVKQVLGTLGYAIGPRELVAKMFVDFAPTSEDELKLFRVLLDKNGFSDIMDRFGYNNASLCATFKDPGGLRTEAAISITVGIALGIYELRFSDGVSVDISHWK